MYLTIVNQCNNQIIADKTIVAKKLWLRIIGLIGKKTFEPGEALIITQCKMVHMFFMQFAIDVLFCAKDNTVLHICNSLKPWRISPIILKADYVIELASDQANLLKIKVGDVIKFVN